MRPNLEKALDDLSKHFQVYAKEYNQNSVLSYLMYQPLTDLIEAIPELRIWSKQHLKESWQNAFERVLERIQEIFQLEQDAIRQQPTDEQALGEYWLQTYLKAFRMMNAAHHNFNPVASLEYQILMRQPSRIRLVLCTYLLEQMTKIKNKDNDQYGESKYQFEYTYKNILGHLLSAEEPIPETLEIAIMDWAGTYSEMQISHQAFFPALIKIIESRVEQNKSVPKEVIAMLRRSGINESATDSSLPSLLNKLVIPPINAGEVWAEALLHDLKTFDNIKIWQEILWHANAKFSKPNVSWEKTALGLLKKIGTETFAKHALSWLEKVGQPRTQTLENAPFARGDANLLFDSFNTRVARGLAWFVALLPESEQAARVMAYLTLTSLKKVAGVGPRDPMLANAGVFALGRMSSLFAVGQLARLKTRVTFKTTLKEIEKALENAAQRQGISKADLEELSIPTCGLEQVGAADFLFGETRAELRVVNSDVALTWFDAKNKILKNPPASLKKDSAEDLKDLKTNLKDLEQMLSAQSVRLERLVLAQKTWDYAAWSERYLEHPVVGCVARRLIWTFSDSGNVQNGVWSSAGIVDSSGTVLEISDAATVSLWHPIDSSVERVLAWRDYFEQHNLVQPWKQAHREIYVLTAAEERTNTYSNRFAAHVLKQHQFNQLAALRGWNNKLRLMVDDSYAPPSLELPQFNLRAEFWVEGAGDNYGTDTTEAGTYLHLSTDQVRFYTLGSSQNYAHAGGGGYEQWVQAGENPSQPLPLEQIPALVFSETMRDIDLFVGVGSVGNDPTWNDGGPNGRYREYWQRYSFGDLSATAESRKTLLEKLLPRLKIKDVTSIHGRFLHVKGSIREYKIHLGSGNILMLPNDQYLCIVPNQAGSSLVQLPFEGDRVLSVILSKAFLLADDLNIKDETITRQLKN